MGFFRLSNAVILAPRDCSEYVLEERKNDVYRVTPGTSATAPSRSSATWSPMAAAGPSFSRGSTALSASTAPGSSTKKGFGNLRYVPCSVASILLAENEFGARTQWRDYEEKRRSAYLTKLLFWHFLLDCATICAVVVLTSRLHGDPTGLS